MYISKYRVSKPTLFYIIKKCKKRKPQPLKNIFKIVKGGISNIFKAILMLLMGLLIKVHSPMYILACFLKIRNKIDGVHILRQPNVLFYNIFAPLVTLTKYIALFPIITFQNDILKIFISFHLKRKSKLIDLNPIFIET